MYFTKRQQGAISVFLTLILLPTLIFGCLTVDAARVYSAKVAISDSGEMAMNAALAQYDTALFDKYGLLAMKKTPEAMQSELQRYFVNSLNSSGIKGASDYEQMLSLISNNFESLYISNTEVYRTEVEKQQILEYMKYRAPVCLTKLVLEKFQFIKETKKVNNAMNKQIDFSESMEKCQDDFKDALQALDALNYILEEVYPDNFEDMIDEELQATEREFKSYVALGYLMSAIFDEYTENKYKPQENLELKELVERYIASAEQVTFDDVDSLYSEKSYSSYLEVLCYENAIGSLGGIEKLNEKSSSTEKEEEKENSDSEANSNSEEKDDTENDNEETEELIQKYKAEKERVLSYQAKLEGFAYSVIQEQRDSLNNYYRNASTAKEKIEVALDHLQEVKDSLLQAQKKYNEWDQASSQLSDDTTGQNMKDQVEKDRAIFGNDLTDLKELEQILTTDKKFFEELQTVLSGEKLYDMQIAVAETSVQSKTYMDEAKKAVKGKKPSYNELDIIRNNTFGSNYEHIKMSTENVMYRIKDNKFYQQLKEYCEETSETSEKEANEANDNLNQSSDNAKTENLLKDLEKVASYDWSQAEQDLPSVKQQMASYTQAKNDLTDLPGNNNIKNSKARKNIISKMRASINEADNFLDGLDRLLTDNIENLYIAEYAMQMFSYYTCDKQMQENKEIRVLTDDENIRLSGYKLSGDKAYKSEVEYILWGDQSAAKNLTSTVMLLFGVRLLFNSIYTFTDKNINIYTDATAIAITGSAPYLKPIVKIALKFGLAGVETGIDMSYLVQGYGVVIVKDETTFESFPSYGGHPDVRGSTKNAVTLDYGEYLRIFLNMKMLTGNEDIFLARIGDCVQINTLSDVTQEYTMVGIQSDVEVKTSFLRKISHYVDADWDKGDSYTVKYKSVLGY